MKLYSVKEVAAMMGVSYSFVRFLILNKRLEAIDVGCKKERIWRVSDSELERFKKDNSSLNIGE